MSTIEEVWAAEMRVREILERLRKPSAANSDHPHEQLKKAQDEFAKVMRELGVK